MNDLKDKLNELNLGSDCEEKEMHKQLTEKMINLKIKKPQKKEPIKSTKTRCIPKTYEHILDDNFFENHIRKQQYQKIEFVEEIPMIEGFFLSKLKQVPQQQICLALVPYQGNMFLNQKRKVIEDSYQPIMSLPKNPSLQLEKEEEEDQE